MHNLQSVRTAFGTNIDSRNRKPERKNTSSGTKKSGKRSDCFEQHLSLKGKTHDIEWKVSIKQQTSTRQDIDIEKDK